MPSLIGPSHHLFYGALHRRRRWLAHLVGAFEPFGGPGWQEGLKRLDTSYARMLARLSAEEHSGLGHPLPLARVLDDTPVDSFLTVLSEELDAYENNLFDLMTRLGRPAGWMEELEQVSMLWGRELAQESLMALVRAHARPAAIPHAGSVRGLYQVFHNVIQGGDFSWRPLLLRRCTDHELQYELRNCPHRKPVASKESADCACRLDSRVHQGFAQALLGDVSFKRRQGGAFCVDELNLR